MILGKAGVESVFLHLVSFAHALQSPAFLQTAVFYFLNEKIDNKCQKRATVSGQIKQNGEWGALRRDFKLLLLHFFMSCVVWLSGSIKIILLSILFLWKNILWVFTMSSQWQKVKTSQLGPFWVQFCDMNNLNQRLITVERWKAFFPPLLTTLFLFCIVTSLSAFLSSALQPCSIPHYGSEVHQSTRFSQLVSAALYKLGDKLLPWEWFYSTLGNTISPTLSVTQGSVLHAGKLICHLKMITASLHFLTV